MLPHLILSAKQGIHYLIHFRDEKQLKVAEQVIVGIPAFIKY